jgi:pyridoxal 5'-phosphate synthase pdxS subunit
LPNKGIATPADAALMMRLGVEEVFVGSGIFESSDQDKRAKAIVMATSHDQEPEVTAEVSKGLGKAITSLDERQIPQESLLAH